MTRALDLDGLSKAYVTGGGRLLKKPTMAYIAALEAAARERDGLRAALSDALYVLREEGLDAAADEARHALTNMADGGER